MNKDFKAEETSDAKKVPKRLAFIKGRTAARVKAEEEEMVMTIPNLVVREAIAFMLMVIILACLSLFFNAPLEWLADTEHTPNPAKAPWYFLGLQELLHYFPPVVAGVLMPTLVVLALVVIPYARVNLTAGPLWAGRGGGFAAALGSAVAALVILFGAFACWPIVVPTLATAAGMFI